MSPKTLPLRAIRFFLFKKDIIPPMAEYYGVIRMAQKLIFRRRNIQVYTSFTRHRLGLFRGMWRIVFPIPSLAFKSVFKILADSIQQIQTAITLSTGSNPAFTAFTLQRKTSLILQFSTLR